jgi:cell division protein FtsL
MPAPDNRKKIDIFKPKVIVQNDKRYRISFAMIFTLILIFLGSLGTALSYALTADTRHQISLVRRQTQEQKESNISLRTEITQRYTLDEVARDAAERMGMNKPDPSQVIHIYVPKQSFVVMNPGMDGEDDGENYFWEGILAFFRQFIN